MLNLFKKLSCGLILSYAAISSPVLAEDAKQPPREEIQAAAPKVDVVFVLDTTGSMGGLLEGAKKKIWAIANELARAKPSPEIRIGLVAYRDKGDAYVTQVTDLTEDLDGIYRTLLEFKAGGGGDGPEHVNQGMKDAIEKMSWAKGDDAFKVIFLVGDAPPHEDYGDNFDHKSLAKSAIEAGIVINTIRCGGDPQTGGIWQEIARRAEGTYVSIDQGGGVAVIATPFDKEMADLGGKLDSTVVAFGDEERRRGLAADAEKTKDALAAAPEAAKADRAAAMGAGAGGREESDLVEAVEHGRVKLEEMKESDLPDEMKKMTAEERKAHVAAKQKEREALSKQLKELDEKRSAWLKEEMAKSGEKDSFDSAVKEALRKQGEKKGLSWEK